MIESVKTALRLRTSAFDEELNDLISAAKTDLQIAGVYEPDESDPVVKRAVITYCKMNFGSPDNYDRLKASYDEQKAQLSMSSDYTVFYG